MYANAVTEGSVRHCHCSYEALIDVVGVERAQGSVGVGGVVVGLKSGVGLQEDDGVHSNHAIVGADWRRGPSQQQRSRRGSRP